MIKKGQFKLFYSLSFAWQLGFIIAAPLVIFVALGFWIDQQLHTSPAILLMGLALAFLITGYEVYHMITPLITETENKNGKH